MAHSKGRIRADSESPAKPKRRKSAPQPRLSKRLKQLGKAHSEDDEPNQSDEPVSARPKRTRAGGINYSLLLPSSDNDENEQPATTLVTEEPKRRSKIITLRTNPSKTLLGNALDLSRRRSRKTASIDDNREMDKSPVVSEMASATRKSSRVKKVADEVLANGDVQSDNPHEVLYTPRKRKSRLISHLDVTGRNANSEPVIDSIKSSRKRKHSEEAADEISPKTAVAAGRGHNEESEHPEKKKKRAKQKLKEDLGFLPNGQPRKRRRRVRSSEDQA